MPTTEHQARAWARKMGKRPYQYDEVSGRANAGNWSCVGQWTWFNDAPNVRHNHEYADLPEVLYDAVEGKQSLYESESAAWSALESAWDAIAAAIGPDDMLRAARKEALDRAAKLVRSKMPHPGGYPGKCLCPICGEYNQLAAAIEALPDEPESADPGIDLKE